MSIVLGNFRLCSFARRNSYDCIIAVESEEQIGLTSEIRLFARITAAKDKSVVLPRPNPNGGGFAEWAMLTLHALRIELGKSYRVAVDLLSEMPGFLNEIGLIKHRIMNPLDHAHNARMDGDRHH